MDKVKPLLFAAAIALTGVVQARAMPALVFAPPADASSAIDVAACGPGTHMGPYGHYCWPNKGVVTGPCPLGYHIGPQGHYCWPNGVNVPAHWVNVCPPGYHLGPEGVRCRLN